MGISFGSIAKSLGSALNQIGTYSAQATAKANAISKQAQSAQGAFNQNSANIANNVDAGRLQSQYDYNTAMMASANEYNSKAWEQAAEWNEMMWQKQADFNAEQAAIQRQWQEKMADTSYQRAMKDMKSAGLNPILAYSNGGANVPGGATASVSGAQMSSAQANMASGGLLGANTASEGNYTGIAENMGTTLAVLGAMFAGISSAFEASEGLGDQGGTIVFNLLDQIEEATETKKAFEEAKEHVDESDSFWDYLKNNWFKDRPGSTILDKAAKPKENKTSRSDAARYSREMSAYKSWEKYSKPKG